MIQLTPTARFSKRLKALSKQQQRQVATALNRFLHNPQYPSLNFEKLSTGQHADYYTIRASLSCRIVLCVRGEDHYEVVDVGDHDVYRRLMRR